MEEEFGDVMVVMFQFALYYGIDMDKVKKSMEYKINRQIRRMEKGE